MGGIWDTYESRVLVRGQNVRGDTLTREKLRVSHMLRDSLSFHPISVYEDGFITTWINKDGDEEDNSVKQDVAIINSDNLNEKYVYSLPDQDIILGSIFFWADNYWIVYEKDANREVYTRAKAIQCNYLLRWVHPGANGPEIREQWCQIEDGTKYMTGELEDRNFVVTRGDARIAMTITRNEYTVKFNRKSRFLVDDTGSDYYLSFDLSKPLKVGHTYNGRGVFKYVLSESNSTPFDNMELGIADYYMFFPDGVHGVDEEENNESGNGAGENNNEGNDNGENNAGSNDNGENNAGSNDSSENNAGSGAGDNGKKVWL